MKRAKPVTTNLRLLRVALALSLEDLAERVGVHPGHLHGVEIGARRAGAGLQRRLAVALGCDVRVLFLEEGHGVEDRAAV